MLESFLKLIALFLVLFFGFVFALRLWAVKRAKEMRGKRVDIIKDGFIYFYSERCGACKVMKPHIEEVKSKVEVKEFDVFSPEGSTLAKELGIMATPTTIYVKNHVIQKVFVGVVKSDRLLAEISQN